MFMKYSTIYWFSFLVRRENSQYFTHAINQPHNDKVRHPITLFTFIIYEISITYPVFFTTVESVYLKVRRYDVISGYSSRS